jgi:hypothetical protein
MRGFWQRLRRRVLAVIGGARASPTAGPLVPARVPVRKLALAVAITCTFAQLLSQIGGEVGDAHGGPPGVVVGQALWNGAQVGLLVLLLSLWCVRRRWWVAALAVATLGCLPFAIYAISPGGWAFTALLLTTCAVVGIRDVPDLDVAIVDAPARGTPLLAKVEFLALVCNLLCSMYNFDPSWDLWPYWNSIFAGVADLTGFTPDLTAIAQGMYGLGLDGVSLPSYIKVGAPLNNLGSVVFAVIWTVLPFLYVLYFAGLAKEARYSPGTRIQRVLCAVAIFHFLFLTDIVDYRFGRGIVNPAAEWCHWLEVFIWRLAILLPIYQKVATGQWLRGNGKAGVAVHYVVGAWAAGFFVYEVLMYNAPMFYAWATGAPYEQITLFGRGYSETVGWHGALVLMIFLYGFMVVAMRCKRVVAERAADGGLTRTRRSPTTSA